METKQFYRVKCFLGLLIFFETDCFKECGCVVSVFFCFGNVWYTISFPASSVLIWLLASTSLTFLPLPALPLPLLSCTLLAVLYLVSYPYNEVFGGNRLFDMLTDIDVWTSCIWMWSDDNIGLGLLPQPPTPKPTLHPLYGDSLHKAMGISRNNGTRLGYYCWNDFSILFFHSFVQVSYLSEI